MRYLPIGLFFVLVAAGGQICQADDRDEVAKADEVAVAVPPMKKQVFFEGGALFSRKGQKSDANNIFGFALIIPLSEDTFVRPFIAGGTNAAMNGSKLSPMVQLGALFGRRSTTRVSVLGGGGLNLFFPKGQSSEVIPTAMVSTMIRLNRSWALLTPVGFSRNGTTVGLQLGYGW